MKFNIEAELARILIGRYREIVEESGFKNKVFYLWKTSNAASTRVNYLGLNYYIIVLKI